MLDINCEVPTLGSTADRIMAICTQAGMGNEMRHLIQGDVDIPESIIVPAIKKITAAKGDENLSEKGRVAKVAEIVKNSLELIDHVGEFRHRLTIRLSQLPDKLTL